jgi:hypothetical protein
MVQFVAAAASEFAGGISEKLFSVSRTFPSETRVTVANPAAEISTMILPFVTLVLVRTGTSIDSGAVESRASPC